MTLTRVFSVKMRCYCFKKLFSVVLTNAQRLCDLHNEEGYEDERKADKVMLPREVDEPEDGVKSGNEHNERNEDNRREGCKIEVLVGERADLEERVLGAHIVRLNYLAKRENHERKGSTAHQIHFVSLVKENTVEHEG